MERCFLEFYSSDGVSYFQVKLLSILLISLDDESLTNNDRAGYTSLEIPSTLDKRILPKIDRSR